MSVEQNFVTFGMRQNTKDRPFSESSESCGNECLSVRTISVGFLAYEILRLILNCHICPNFSKVDWQRHERAGKPRFLTA